DSPHRPELDDLGTLADVVGDRSQKRVHVGFAPDLFQYFASGGRKRAFVVVDLSFWKHPVVVFPQLHDGNQRFTTAAQHHPTSRKYWRARFLSTLHSGFLD